MPLVAIVMGSKSDTEAVQPALEILKDLGIDYEVNTISAHRNPEKLRALCKQMGKDGIEVVIACAGKAAALPGFIASYVDIPVIGVALKGGLLDGVDALLSIISTPRGIGLVSSGVGLSAFINAQIAACEILALQYPFYREAYASLKKKYK